MTEKILINSGNDKKSEGITDNILEGSKTELINTLEPSKICKGKVFFVRHGMTEKEERRKRKEESGEKVDGILTQSADTRLGVKGKEQIRQSASKLRPFLRGGKVVFAYSSDGEEDGRLGAHERINESLYIMLCELTGIEDQEYTREKLEELIIKLEEDSLGNMKFIKTSQLNTTTKIIVDNKRVLENGPKLSSKNLGVSKEASDFLGSEEILNAENDTKFVIVSHKAVKGGIVNSAFGDDKDYDINFELGGGEIIDFDISEGGRFIGEYKERREEKDKERYYRKGFDILFLKPSNLNEILSALDGEFKDGFEKVIREGGIIMAQNYINAYFKDNPELFKKYIRSDCLALKLFSLSNLISLFDFDTIKNNVKELVYNEDIAFFLTLFSEYYGVDKIQAEIVFYETLQVYKKEYLNPLMDIAKRKSLDPRIAGGKDMDPIFNLGGFNVGKDTILGGLTDYFGEKNIKYIEGNAGSGKSYFLSFIIEQLGEKSFELPILKEETIIKNEKIIPIYFHLSGIENVRKLEERIRKIIKKYFSKLGSYLHELDYECVLILDGLDEMKTKNKEKTISDLFEYLESLPRVIITSRIGNLRNINKYKNIERFYLGEFDEALAKDYIKKYFKYKNINTAKLDNLISQRSFGGILRNPMILSMLCEIASRGEDIKKYINRSLLYQDAVLYGLKEWEKGKIDIVSRPIIDLRIKLLAKIAYDDAGGGFAHNYESLAEYIEQNQDYRIAMLNNNDEIDLRYLNSLYRFNEENGKFEFIHQSFEDYFNALGIFEELENSEYDSKFIFNLLQHSYEVLSFICDIALMRGCQDKLLKVLIHYPFYKEGIQAKLLFMLTRLDKNMAIERMKRINKEAVNLDFILFLDEIDAYEILEYLFSYLMELVDFHKFEQGLLNGKETNIDRENALLESFILPTEISYKLGEEHKLIGNQVWININGIIHLINKLIYICANNKDINFIKTIEEIFGGYIDKTFIKRISSAAKLFITENDKYWCIEMLHKYQDQSIQTDFVDALLFILPRGEFLTWWGSDDKIVRNIKKNEEIKEYIENKLGYIDDESYVDHVFVEEDYYGEIDDVFEEDSSKNYIRRNEKSQTTARISLDEKFYDHFGLLIDHLQSEYGLDDIQIRSIFEFNYDENKEFGGKYLKIGGHALDKKKLKGYLYFSVRSKYFEYFPELQADIVNKNMTICDTIVDKALQFAGTLQIDSIKPKVIFNLFESLLEVFVMIEKEGEDKCENLLTIIMRILDSSKRKEYIREFFRQRKNIVFEYLVAYGMFRLIKSENIIVEEYDLKSFNHYFIQYKLKPFCFKFIENLDKYSIEGARGCADPVDYIEIIKNEPKLFFNILGFKKVLKRLGYSDTSKVLSHHVWDTDCGSIEIYLLELLDFIFNLIGDPKGFEAYFPVLVFFMNMNYEVMKKKINGKYTELNIKIYEILLSIGGKNNVMWLIEQLIRFSNIKEYSSLLPLLVGIGGKEVMDFLKDNYKVLNDGGINL